MNYPTLKVLAVLLPTWLIGGFEYARHVFLLDLISMEMGNLFITLLTLVTSYVFTAWMFGRIKQIHERLAQERSMRAVYEERERLASELHDNIAQTLFFLKAKLQKGQLQEAKSAVSEINNELRQAIFNLRALPDEGIELQDRIKNWMDEWSLLSGIETETDIDMDHGYFSPKEEILLFGVVQEAFTNIRKHAEADRARLLLKAADAGWFMRIADNGCVPDVEGREDVTYGLPLMKKRARDLGADFAFGKNANGETEILLTSAGREAAHADIQDFDRR